MTFPCADLTTSMAFAKAHWFENIERQLYIIDGACNYNESYDRDARYA